MSRSPNAAALRARLTNARALCSALGLLDGYKPGQQARGGLFIRCPAHPDRTPSCSVRPGHDGTLAVRCFGCGFTGDALTLIATAHGLNLRANFPVVLEEAARIAGIALETGRAWTPRPAPAPAYPDQGEVKAFWWGAESVKADDEAQRYLKQRAIHTDRVQSCDLARVLRPGGQAPAWARCRGNPWSLTHRLILPVVDYLGVLRSLRAWCFAPHPDTPKRIAPAGKALSGLILACPTAREMLANGQAPHAGRPFDVLITEGEPDFLTWASRVSDTDETPPAILGVVAGSWCDAIASRIPDGARVIVRTHQDPTGDRYASEIKASLASRTITLLDFQRRPHGEAA